ncbi:MAG: hypothetical protein AAF483_27575, partial [Planctomycetota bacterium]
LLGLGPTRIPTLGMTVNYAIRSSAILRDMWWWWGFPIIMLVVIFTGQPQYEDQFYLARYELSRSRYKYAGSQKNAAKKKEQLAQAKKAVVSTATLYPELGGAEMKRKFDTLMKTIEKELGEPQKGLNGLSVGN